MAKKIVEQQQPVDLNLLVRSIVLVAQKIESLTDEVKLLRKQIANGPTKEEHN